MKKSLVLAMAMALGVTASAYAANPFSDVPAGHWAYDSISKLAAAGVIEGYGDTTFGGDKLMTRYEMAQIVAKAMAKGANCDKLAAEFADELDNLGVRVANLEKKADNVKITGEIRAHYEDYKDTKDADRFDEVKRIEAMSPEEKFAFFQSELSKCIRCNACRNVCPACSCRKCVFDSNKFDSSQKANADSFEEKMFHIIRAFHVAGRCTDCGECSRVCPQGIPLHLFNRKFIKDINEFYGEYQAGENLEEKAPLTNFTFGDVEPSIVGERG